MQYVGVDGCRGGWCFVALDTSGRVECGVVTQFQEIYERYQNAELILVDIPIGLVESGHEERLCDLEARKALRKPRSASVFPAPCRPAVYKNDYETASNLNNQLCGRRLSQQAWGITPKIREMDQFVSEFTESRGTVREVHPEVLFWALNHRSAMEHKKKSAKGQSERIKILSELVASTPEIIDKLKTGYLRKVVALDDMTDAIAAAATGLTAHGRLQTLPETPVYDATGLPMEMVFYSR